MSLCPRGTIPYRIKQGDTFNILAQRFNTTIKAITSVNPGVSPNNLQVGQSICIPIRRSVVPCSPGNRYIIKAGDTFSKLSQRYGLSIAAITALNPGVEPSNLRVGQVICLPVRRRRR
ncbi:MAG: putative peptidoglycan endopeptidase LytE [Candidatus Dichloromethanomonas elyunquensis]|nr:MAG: putative peptidoglycan endopeptidase LytE [Candidatus Dichloromethanomonas elyunquensis]